MRGKKNTEAPEIEHICAYCVYASPIENADACVCEKKGTVRASGSCRKYRFDPLKLKPRLPLLPDYEEQRTPLL